MQTLAFANRHGSCAIRGRQVFGHCQRPSCRLDEVQGVGGSHPLARASLPFSVEEGSRAQGCAWGITKTGCHASHGTRLHLAVCGWVMMVGLVPDFHIHTIGHREAKRWSWSIVDEGLQTKFLAENLRSWDFKVHGPDSA